MNVNLYLIVVIAILSGILISIQIKTRKLVEENEELKSKVYRMEANYQCSERRAATVRIYNSFFLKHSEQFMEASSNNDTKSMAETYMTLRRINEQAEFLNQPCK